MPPPLRVEAHSVKVNHSLGRGDPKELGCSGSRWLV